MDYETIGNRAHLATIANASIYAIAVVAFNDSSIFDATWKPHGFCVANQDVPFFNSHDLCFYFDTFASIIFGLIYYTIKDVPGMGHANDLVKFNVFGIFAHGLGHGLTSHVMRHGMGVEVDDEMKDMTDAFHDNPTFETFILRSPGWVAFLIFWMGLLRGSMPMVSWKAIAPLSIIAVSLNIFVRDQFAFTYVQTVLLFAFSFNQLCRPGKEKRASFEYALFPMVTALPLIAIGWLESTQCDAFLVGIGGHLVYDAYIPISLIVFYLICWKKVTVKKVKEM